jgi:hypothetical protein
MRRDELAVDEVLVALLQRDVKLLNGLFLNITTLNLIRRSATCGATSSPFIVFPVSTLIRETLRLSILLFTYS